MSIGDMINASVRCVECNAQGVGSCNCWTKCSVCRWTYETGGECRNCAGSKEPMQVMAIGKLNLLSAQEEMRDV